MKIDRHLRIVKIIQSCFIKTVITKYFIIQFGSTEVIISNQKLLCLFLEASSISAPGSFMFSLRNNDNLEPFKTPLKDENDKNAIRREKENGPIFGVGHDLNIAHDAGSNSLSLANFGASYQSPTGYTYGQPNAQFLLAGSFKFRLSEIEVFYLIWNSSYLLQGK